MNANGNKVDVWLIYRCKKCKHSWNLTIYERTKPSRIDREEYELFLENDSLLAEKYGNNIEFLKNNNAELIKKSTSAKTPTISVPIEFTTKREGICTDSYSTYDKMSFGIIYARIG